jgi:hypothetical protein
VGFTPDTPAFYEELTVRQFLRFVAKGYDLVPQIIDIVHAATQVPQMEDPPFGFVTSLSPAGAVGLAKAHPDQSFYPGIACQARLTLFTAALYYNSLRKIPRSADAFGS